METSRLKELSTTYDLKGTDFHIQNYGGKQIPFMKKSGIDKIQAIENIDINFEPIDVWQKIEVEGVQFLPYAVLLKKVSFLLTPNGKQTN